MPVNYTHTLIQDENGDLYSCGLNDRGQLGTGDEKQRTLLSKITAPVKFVSFSAGAIRFSICVAEDGSLWSFGDNLEGQKLYISNVDFVFPNPTKLQDNSA
jgi:alpha-tubulin suppressor-like RCC1 family protein